jgi:hypothetical protein
VKKHILWPRELQAPGGERHLFATAALFMVFLLMAAAITAKKDKFGVAIPLGAIAAMVAGFGYSGASRLHMRRWRCLRRFATQPRCAGRIVALEARDFLVQPADGSAPARVVAANLTLLVESADPKTVRPAGIAIDRLVIVAGDLSHEPHPVGQGAGYREPPRRAVYSNAVAIQVADLGARIPVHQPLLMAIATFLFFAVLGLGSYALFSLFHW